MEVIRSHRRDADIESAKDLLFLWYRDPPKSPLFPSPPLFRPPTSPPATRWARSTPCSPRTSRGPPTSRDTSGSARSEEHTSELQSRQYLVCRLLLEKKQ